MIKFIKLADPDNKYDVTDIEITIKDHDIGRSSVIEEFVTFLGACGYSTKDLDEDLNVPDVKYK